MNYNYKSISRKLFNFCCCYAMLAAFHPFRHSLVNQRFLPPPFAVVLLLGGGDGDEEEGTTEANLVSPASSTKA